MAKIIPIKELKNTAEISALCHNSPDPIYITKNGYGDMVIMSMEIYEEIATRLNAYQNLLNQEKADKGMEKMAKDLSQSDVNSEQTLDSELKVLSLDEIKSAAKAQLEKYHAEYAILFGSYARGEATPESDVDLVVVGGEKFTETDIFLLGEDFRAMIGRDADVYEMKEIETNTQLYENIMREGIKIA